MANIKAKPALRYPKLKTFSASIESLLSFLSSETLIKIKSKVFYPGIPNPKKEFIINNKLKNVKKVSPSNDREFNKLPYLSFLSLLGLTFLTIFSFLFILNSYFGLGNSG